MDRFEIREEATRPFPQPAFTSTRRYLRCVAVVLAIILACPFVRIGAAQQARSQTVLDKIKIQAIILAVEDEIYDRSYQKQFYDVGPEPQPGDTRLPLYIEPTLKNREGAVIYKLLPYGEVIRHFHFDHQGLAVLEGDPSSGFRPTQPNTMTLYMDDDDVCRWKHTWLRTHFDVFDNPAPGRVAQAIERQKHRIGYSAHGVPARELRKFPPR